MERKPTTFRANTYQVSRSGSIKGNSHREMRHSASKLVTLVEGGLLVELKIRRRTCRVTLIQSPYVTRTHPVSPS